MEGLRRRPVDCMETEEPAGRAGSCVAAYSPGTVQRQRQPAFARQKSALRAARQGFAGSQRSLRAMRLDTTTRRGRMILVPKRIARREPIWAPRSEAPAITKPMG